MTTTSYRGSPVLLPQIHGRHNNRDGGSRATPWPSLA
jgi:hypothetical protein